MCVYKHVTKLNKYQYNYIWPQSRSCTYQFGAGDGTVKKQWVQSHLWYCSSSLTCWLMITHFLICFIIYKYIQQEYVYTFIYVKILILDIHVKVSCITPIIFALNKCPWPGIYLSAKKLFCKEIAYHLFDWVLCFGGNWQSFVSSPNDHVQSSFWVTIKQTVDIYL